MLSQLIEVVAPVFGVALAGWIFAGFRRVEMASITDLLLNLSAPALVFASLAGRDVAPRALLAVGGGAFVQIVVTGAVAWLVFKALRMEAQGLQIAAMFPNTGNLGLPIALFAFGQEGLAAAVIVFVSVTLLHYSLGLAILSGSVKSGAALRSPLMWSALGGFAVALADIELPEPLLDGVTLLGDAAVPLMLVSLGIRMRSVRLTRPGPALLAVALRMLPGLAAAWAYVELAGLEGPERGVVLVTGVLPSAVMNFMLAEAYKRQPEDVASAIFLGTLIAAPAISAVLAFMT